MAAGGITSRAVTIPTHALVMLRRMRAWAVIAILTFAPCGASAAERLVLTTEENPPYNFVEDGAIVGIGADAAREALSRAQIAYEFALLPWSRAYERALAEPDVCVFSINRTPARESLFQWIGPISSGGWALFAAQDAPIEALNEEDAKRFRIGVTRNTAIHHFLIERGFENLEPVESTRINMLKLDRGRIDLAAGGLLTAPFNAAREGASMPKRVLMLRRSTLFIGCNQGSDPDLVARLDAAMGAMIADGRLAAIQQGYLRAR